MERENLQRIALDVCAMVLPEGGVRAVDPSGRDFEFVGCVDLFGCPIGAVVFACDQGVADAVATHMFGHEPSSPADPRRSDLFDALREVANLLGGNIKGWVAPGATLSLPRATRGDEALLENGRERVLQEIQFTSPWGDLSVRVLVDRSSEVASGR